MVPSGPERFPHRGGNQASRNTVERDNLKGKGVIHSQP
jgi:hypothetical protein